MTAPTTRSWALVITSKYRKAYNRVPPKFQNQVARKVQDLALDPTPGGSKCAVQSLEGVFRLRAGDFRIFYNYSTDVVQLLYLSRRDDHTYDDLNHVEVEALAEYSLAMPAAPAPRVPQWERVVADADTASGAAPGPEELPRPIDKELLEELEVPRALFAELMEIRYVDELLSAENIPADIRMAIVEAMLPTGFNESEALPAVPVRRQADLIPPAIQTFAGPVAANPDHAVEDGGQRADPRAPFVPRVISQSEASMRPCRGNATSGVGKEAKYVVKMDGTIQLTYAVNDAERALVTVDGHDELVTMVNEAKRAGGASQQGGRFVINEHRQVLVPTEKKGILVAGVYTRDLEFHMETGTILSPVAPPGIRVGGRWPGPRVGIRYTVSAGATDVRYEAREGNGGTRRVALTDFYDPAELTGLFDMLRKVKPQGGALFINEAREFFAPTQNGSTYEITYVGPLGQHPWFPPG